MKSFQTGHHLSVDTLMNGTAGIKISFKYQQQHTKIIPLQQLKIWIHNYQTWDLCNNSSLFMTMGPNSYFKYSKMSAKLIYNTQILNTLNIYHLSYTNNCHIRWKYNVSEISVKFKHILSAILFTWTISTKAKRVGHEVLSTILCALPLCLRFHTK